LRYEPKARRSDSIQTIGRPLYYQERKKTEEGEEVQEREPIKGQAPTGTVELQWAAEKKGAKNTSRKRDMALMG